VLVGAAGSQPAALELLPSQPRATSGRLSAGTTLARGKILDVGAVL